MKLHVAICDDEKAMIDVAKEKLSHYRPEYEVDTYCSGEMLLEAEIAYDMIFLDIEMPGKNGMEIADDLRKKGYDGHIVFLTSYSEFMQEAFKVRAFRFLKKPICDADFEETVMEAEKEIAENRKIVIKTQEGTRAINIRDIIFIETVRNYTYISVKGSEIETRKSLREWMEILGNEHFCHVHKSYAVAFRHIEMIENNNIIMKGADVKIPISRKRLGEVKEAFFSYVDKYALSI